MAIKTIQFRIKRDHPDYTIAAHHCYEVRRLRNSMNSLLRSAYFYYLDSTADLTIAQQYGVEDLIRKGEVKASRTDYLKKLVVPVQSIDLPAKVAGAAARVLTSSWSSFYALRKAGERAKIPGYSKVFRTAEYNNQAISKRELKKGVIKPTGWSTGVELPSDFTGKVKAARVLPDGNSFSLHVVYEDNAIIDYAPVPGLMAGIDPGLNNLLTIAFNDLREGIIIDGKPLKKLNSNYNKVTSELASKLDVEKRNISKKVNKGVKRGEPGYTHVYRQRSARLDELWSKRDHKMKHYYTTATSKVVEHLCAAGVETVVIGWNQGNKQHVNMGRRNNRNFVQVPLKAILDDLARKLRERGVKVVFTEESYTSKSSFLDGDSLPVYGDGSPRPVFSGKRVRRGLYESANGSLINADLNGALNIIRKYDSLFSYAGVVASIAGTFAGTRVVVPSARRVTFSY